MENLPAVRTGIPSDHEMMVFQTMAETAVSSKMYKGIGEKAGVMMIMLSARELGISPMQALNGGLNIINGKVEISARMMSALIRKSGHSIKVHTCSNTECILIGKRADTGETQTSSFTIQEAQQAGLVKSGGGWTKWPKDMCFARALSRLSRQLFSDVIGIGYVEGEISPAESKIGLPDDLIIEIPNIIDNEKEFADLTAHFEDKESLMKYIDVVMKHFSWSQDQTVREFLKDVEKTKEKFSDWLLKQPKES